ncbi:site-specific integrase [Croceivirga sp. JEA036]|nr:site-specific integrase [Croceivirga sp. JEA036]
MRIFDQEGNRLYLNQKEIQQFLKTAKQKNAKIRTLAETLTYTGCRLSEALAITPENILFNDNQVVINSLKKRKTDHYRILPVPREYMEIMVVAHDIQQRQKQKNKKNLPLWDWSRQHAYELIKGLMVESGIPPGKNRSPKGLRHAFGVNAVTKDISLSMLKKWMGHAHISTTEIYANAIGKEEALMAQKMWTK